MKALCQYDPYFSRTKHFRRTFKVSLNDGMISIGQYGMTSSVYRCGLVQCMYEFIVCMYYGYECSFIYHVYRGYSPFMYCMCVYVCIVYLYVWYLYACICI